MFVSLVFDIKEEPMVYINTYQISESSKIWSRRSINHFLIEHYIVVAIQFILLTIVVYSFFSKRKIWELLNYIISGCIIVYSGISVYKFISGQYGF